MSYSRVSGKTCKLLELALLSHLSTLDSETGLKMVVIKCFSCGKRFEEALDTVLAQVCCDIRSQCLRCDAEAGQTSGVYRAGSPVVGVVVGL